MRESSASIIALMPSYSAFAMVCSSTGALPTGSYPVSTRPSQLMMGACFLSLYYVENSHEAIIPRDLFLQVQEEMVRRARLETGTGKRRVYSGKYALSHLVYCAHCGDIYRRTQWWIRGEKIPVWRCISRIEKRKANVDCPSRTIYEKDMHAAVVTAFNQLIAQEG